jgi:DNA-binding transcriptional LysR family regulator
MELSWLEDFLALVDCRNFSRAAELRHMTQPAFSRRIRALETWVGVALFDRTSHPVPLTEAGQRFRPVADEMLRRLFQARESAREADRLAATTLRFAATHALSLTFFPSWLRRFEVGTKPGAIRLMSESMQTCERIMMQGEAQFLLCHYHPAAVSGLDPTQFRSIRIGEDVLMPVSAPDDRGHPRYALVAGVAGAAGLPYLAYSTESGMGRIVRAAQRVERMALLDPVVTSHLAGVLRAMAADGRGIAWLPRSLISEDLDRAVLVLAGDETWQIPMEIHLFRPRARQSAAAEQFWSFVAA